MEKSEKGFIQRIKGVKDILPEETIVWNHVFHKAREIFKIFGYSEIIIPIIEITDLFLRSVGETTDIVEKEMYTFIDRDGKKISLRPEGTASVVRAYIENHLFQKAPFHRLYYIGPMFRRERPQAGRYRQFYQIGAEVFGFDRPMIDAEVLYMLDLLFKALHIQNIELQINSIGCSSCRPAFREALRNYFKEKLNELCENCQRRFTSNPLRILDCKSTHCHTLTKGTPGTTEYLCSNCRDHFQSLQGYLKVIGIGFKINPRLVRGLDYYTRTAFEFISTSLGAQNAVAAGGRYDNLVEELGGPPTPAIGFSIGVERLLSLFDEKSIPGKGPEVYIISLGEKTREKAFHILKDLHTKGIPAIIDYSEKSLKSHMRRAGKLEASHVLIIGEEELARNTVILRDMVNKAQWEVPGNEVAARLKGIEKA